MVAMAIGRSRPSRPPCETEGEIGVAFNHELPTGRAEQGKRRRSCSTASQARLLRSPWPRLLPAPSFRRPSTRTQAQSPAASAPGPVLKTPWGEPDLQGIWMEETDTPLQRPAKYADQEFFTEAQRAELDYVRSALAGKDKRAERGTELDVGGSYNQLFVPRKHTGARTSMVVDPPNGRIPQLTAEAQKIGRRRTGISPRSVAIDRDLQDRIPHLCRRQIRSEPLAAARGACPALQHRGHESP